jgi:beta-fructofuranosidase
VRVRPIFHFTADAGWINDPHGVAFHDGRYHLFHQYVPGGPAWAPDCHWGHATSTDLLTWTRHDVALAPGDGDDGVWSGSLVQAGGDARIFYTSVSQPDLGHGRVRVARPTDDGWEQWVKGEVVVEPPAEADLLAHRDPFVVRDGPGWRMLVGGATRAGDAVALGYTSADLSTWTYAGIAARRSSRETDPVWTGELWECPQLVDVDGVWALVVSVWANDELHRVAYGVGSWRHGRFVATGWGRLTDGDSYYAASSFRDREGRPCLILWMRGVADEEEGWAGCLSVPYLLSASRGRLVATPHPAVAAARGPRLDAGRQAGAFDVRWSPHPGGDQLVLAATTGAETARIVVADGAVSLERAGADTSAMPWSGEELRVLVDGPVLEVSGAGLLGGRIDPTGTWRATRGACEAWEVRPPAARSTGARPAAPAPRRR